jgi:His-Xaa-Ser system radical SAM maturase HxsB
MSAKKPDITPHFYWGRLGKGYLVTNDAGEHARLSPAQFRRYSRTGGLPASAALDELRSKGFVRSELDFADQAAKWGQSNSYVRRGPGLHIMVLTLRCDHACLYCQAGAGRAGGGASDMSPATVRKTIDFILSSPCKGVTVEFQGGEPLLNWPALREAVLYGERAAASSGKDMKFALVSNFSLMTLEKAAFLVKHRVALCTSLDGPAALHDMNRPRPGGGSHARAVRWLRYFRKALGACSDCGPSALLTVSKCSLGREREIIGEYARLGLTSVFVRPPAPIGFARDVWGRIGCTPEEFTGFYSRSLELVLDLNRKGVPFREKTAFLIVKKALGFEDNHYVDLRCPCGAGLGQLAYDHNGDIYTCDEGRMLARQGDDVFKAGNVRSSTYAGVISAPAVKACAASSCLDSQPLCARCVWRPYCGVCPVYNYQTQGSLWGFMPANERCRIMKGVFEAVFRALGDPSAEKIFRRWLD